MITLISLGIPFKAKKKSLRYISQFLCLGCKTFCLIYQSFKEWLCTWIKFFNFFSWERYCCSQTLCRDTSTKCHGWEKRTTHSKCWHIFIFSIQHSNWILGWLHSYHRIPYQSSSYPCLITKHHLSFLHKTNPIYTNLKSFECLRYGATLERDR